MALRIHPASHDAELLLFSPRNYNILFCHLTYVRLWGERFRRRNNSSKQQQSHLDNFVVTVDVALGHSLYFLSQPPSTLLSQVLLQLFLPIIN